MRVEILMRRLQSEIDAWIESTVAKPKPGSQPRSEILVLWSEDRRGSSEPIGARFEMINHRHWTGRKLVRLDRKARIAFPAKVGEVQSCRITHDTQPGDDSRGVLFVVPTGPGAGSYTPLTVSTSHPG